MIGFNLMLQLPPDAGFAPMVRDLALLGARQAGCAEAECVAFASQVEDAAREALNGARGAEGATVPIAVTRDKGPIEVVIGSGATARTMTLEV